MKIRTDFVTNSSSSNYVTISIKSPKLTEIMCAARLCKEDGEPDTWGCRDRLEIDESEQIVKLVWEISSIISDGGEWNMEDLEQMEEEDLVYIGYPPVSLSDIPENFVRLLKEGGEHHLYQQGYDLTKICSALEKSGDDILADTESADWSYKTEGHGEAVLFKWFWILSKMIAKKENLDYLPSFAYLSSSFHYDRENGESFKGGYSYDGNEGDMTYPFEDDFTEEDMGYPIEDDFTEEDMRYSIQDDFAEGDMRYPDVDNFTEDEE